MMSNVNVEGNGEEQESDLLGEDSSSVFDKNGHDDVNMQLGDAVEKLGEAVSTGERLSLQDFAKKMSKGDLRAVRAFISTAKKFQKYTARDIQKVEQLEATAPSKGSLQESVGEGQESAASSEGLREERISSLLQKKLGESQTKTKFDRSALKII